MKTAIIKYFEKLTKYPDYYKEENLSKISNEIKNQFCKGKFLIERKDESDISLFEKEFGYKLPTEIVSYINIFWHPWISGYYNTKQAIVLFSVMNNEGDSSDDVLFYENGLFKMAREWKKIGDIKKYIPIGWLANSGTYVLYEVKNSNILIENEDIDGEVGEKPIASSLKELISNMEIV